MKSAKTVLSMIILCLPLLACEPAASDEIRVAVASNFTEVMKRLAARFEERTGHRVKLIFGSTGKHYAQIKNGAPFDLFFAADSKRPRLLEEEGAALPGSRFTYAIGKLVLWSPNPGLVDPEATVLRQGTFRHLAIANPKLAPYGKAAREVLLKYKLWDSLRGRSVRGENIGQTFQFVKSGNAELGFVAYAQVKRPGQPIEGSYWAVPQALYSPIAQQAIQLKESEVAKAFISFVKGDESLQIIQGFGYGIP
ncbi:MAG: molybdate ABC transporter substrate-binding protein [Candidatus Sedimenticola sp. 20ELBAFRAG]